MGNYNLKSPSMALKCLHFVKNERRDCILVSCNMYVQRQIPTTWGKGVWIQWNGMMDLNGGMEWWTGTVEWNGGLERQYRMVENTHYA